MADMLVLSLVEKQLVADQVVLTVGYDTSNLATPEQRAKYSGETRINHYGREVPKEAHGGVRLGRHTSSSRRIVEAVDALFGQVVDPALLVRRITVAANHVLSEREAKEIAAAGDEQPDLFLDREEAARRKAEEEAGAERDKKLQHAILDIKRKLGKNAILKGMNLLDGATAKERNQQVGGHRE